jgi:pimeloyl-ACP methyl ester carboxylesterase
VPYVRARGVDLHYVEHGPSAADAERTAVVLHGFSLDQRSAAAAFEPSFRSRPGWRRLYLDFPGMGGTVAPDWVASTDDVLDVTRGAVDALVAGPYALGGISFGGYVAAGLVATAPERVTGLALVVPMVKDRAHREIADFAVLRRDPGLALSETMEMAVVQTEQVARRVAVEVDVAAELADEATIERIDSRYAGSFPLSPSSGHFDRPGLVVVGRQDNVLGYHDQWLEYGRWPRTTFAVLDGAGHLLNIERAALFDTLVADWIDRIETDPPDGTASS